jgi:hypothetical protein
MINTGRRGDAGQGRILNMHERPDTFALSDTWHLAPSDVVGSGAFQAVPRVRTVEDSIAQGDALHFSRMQQSCFHVGRHRRTRGHASAGIGRQTRRRVRQSSIRPQKKAARLLDVATHPGRPCGTMKIATALKPQLPIAGECRGLSRGIVRSGSPLIDDDLGLRSPPSLFHGGSIACVHNGHGHAHVDELLHTCLGAVHAHDRVTVTNHGGDQWRADRSTYTGNKDPHITSFLVELLCVRQGRIFLHARRHVCRHCTHDRANREGITGPAWHGCREPQLTAGTSPVQ